MMNLLLSLILCFAASLSLANESISGFFIVAGQNNYKIILEKNTVLTLRPGNTEVAAQLKNLKNSDIIRGVGTFINNDTLILDSIDFVGLKRLIGTWRSAKTILDFKNFDDVTFYQLSTALAKSIRTDYKYVVSPGGNSNWQMFFLDENDVTIANLVLPEGNRAQLTFYDPETGLTKATMYLTKVKYREEQIKKQ